jgi:hypothetical protein
MQTTDKRVLNLHRRVCNDKGLSTRGLANNSSGTGRQTSKASGLKTDHRSRFLCLSANSGGIERSNFCPGHPSPRLVSVTTTEVMYGEWVNLKVCLALTCDWLVPDSRSRDKVNLVSDSGEGQAGSRWARGGCTRAFDAKCHKSAPAPGQWASREALKACSRAHRPAGNSSGSPKGFIAVSP